jgi:hypothetical protein
MRIKIIRDDISPVRVLIPGLTQPALYLIRGNPVFLWIPAFAGMTFSARTNVAVYRNFFTHHSIIPIFHFVTFDISQISV